MAPPIDNISWFPEKRHQKYVMILDWMVLMTLFSWSNRSPPNAVSQFMPYRFVLIHGFTMPHTSWPGYGKHLCVSAGMRPWSWEVASVSNAIMMNHPEICPVFQYLSESGVFCPDLIPQIRQHHLKRVHGVGATVYWYGNPRILPGTKDFLMFSIIRLWEVFNEYLWLLAHNPIRQPGLCVTLF